MRQSLKTLLILAALAANAINADAQNATTFAPLDVDDAHTVIITRAPSGGGIAAWRVEVCARPDAAKRKPECGHTDGLLSVAQSTSVRNIVKTVMLPAYGAEHGLTVAP